MISHVKVSLSHLLRSVMNDLAGLSLSEGDPASVSALITLSAEGIAFWSPSWQRKGFSHFSFYVCRPVQYKQNFKMAWWESFSFVLVLGKNGGPFAHQASFTRLFH